MAEFESLANAVIALQKEKKRQEQAELGKIKERNKMLKQETRLEYLRQKRRQRQISYHKRQQRRIAEIEAAKILYQDEVEMLSTLAQNAQGLEAQRLELLAQKR